MLVDALMSQCISSRDLLGISATDKVLTGRNILIPVKGRVVKTRLETMTGLRKKKLVNLST